MGEVREKLRISLLGIGFLNGVGFREKGRLGVIKEGVIVGFFGADSGADPKLLIYYIC